VIGFLHGELLSKEPTRLLIAVQGVGYEVEAPMSTFLSLPPAGTQVSLHIHHVLREDASLLFGFSTEAERALFRALLKVNGVGPKMALAILSAVDAATFQRAIAESDVAGLTRIPGVGRKTAERLLVEMRDHFTATPAPGGLSPAWSPRDEALHALLALGYKPAEATRMLEKVHNEGASTEELIRAALRSVTGK
jgi:Holliday junction DNA helicase RuvA